MDDEEYTYQALQEPLYRVETGNYEYRLVLRCRQEARKRFAALRSDVLVKLELLDQKHVHNIATQIIQFITLLEKFNSSCHSLMSENCLFPIELDLSKSCLLQTTTSLTTEEYQDDDAQLDDDGLVEVAEDATNMDNNKTSNTETSDIDDLIDIFGNLSSKNSANNHQTPSATDKTDSTLLDELLDHSDNESTSNSRENLLF